MMSAHEVAEINERRRLVRLGLVPTSHTLDALAWACSVMRPAELDGLR